MHSIQSYCEVVVVVVSAAAVRPRSSTIRHFIDILHAFHLEMRVRFAMNAIFHSPLIIALQRELRVAPLLGVNRWYARCDRVALIVKCYIHWRRRFSSPRHVLWTNAMLWFSSSSLVSSGIQQWTKHSHCWERIKGRTEELSNGRLLGSPRRPSNTLPPTCGAASFSHSLLRLQEPFVSPWCSCFIKIFLMCDGTVTTFLCKSTDVGSTISIIISLIAIVAANKRILRKCENFNYA